MNIQRIGGTTVWLVHDDGPELGNEETAIDLIGETYGQGVDLVAVPVRRLAPSFLQLRTGMAGAFLQKFMTYGYRVAIVGDISGDVAASKSLGDFVRESNRVGRVIFADSEETLRERLESASRNNEPGPRDKPANPA